MSKLALWAQTVDIANLPPRQDLLAKNVLMTAQRDFGLGNSLFDLDKWGLTNWGIEEFRDLGIEGAWRKAQGQRLCPAFVIIE
jgi:hypothetical protein